jgi:mono/diheme cytochrome c family protein
MKTSLQVHAFARALMAALLSLVGAGLAALSIQKLPSTSAPSTTTPAPSSDIVASPELIAQGHQFFAMSCSECHGDDATGDEGPDLHNLSISNARIARTIKHGVKGEMPTFAKKYDDQQIAALVAYLRSLR